MDDQGLKTKDSVEGLVALIAELEKAEEGSRELDARIHVAVNNWTLARLGPDAFGENACEIYTPDGKLYGDGFTYPPKGKLSPFYHVPSIQYTTSIDAALTLVRGLWCIYAMEEPGCTYLPANVDGSFTHARNINVDHCKPAIALCIAALRARQSFSGERVS